jgi:competence protein ComEA
VDGGGRSTIAIWVVAAVLAVIAGMRLFGGTGGDPPAVSIDGPGAGDVAAASAGAAGTAAGAGSGGAASAGAAGGAGSGGAAGGAGELYVHVAGAVRRPGLVRVAPGTRVATALERAGGPTRRADLTLVNLAAKVQDGQQIVVPVAGAGGAGTGGPAAADSGALAGQPGSAGSLPAPKVHLSTATVEQLDQIDGIGPTLAARIVEYRDTHAGFRSINELAQVDGIGEKRLATLRDALQP